jgi:SAM-dependent methyltransferase
VRRPGVRAGYGEDLAYIHDAGFGEVAAAASAFVIEHLRSSGSTNGTVTDLGCGSGLMAAQLVQAGYSVFGVDISPSFVELARRRVPRGDFVVGSFIGVQIPASVAIAAVGEVLNYCFDEANGPEAWRVLFERCHAALAPRGFLVFDMAGPSRALSATRSGRTLTGSDWSVSTTTTVDASRRMLTRRITSHRAVAGATRSTHETHRLLLAEPTGVLEALRSTGFEAEALPSYGEAALPEGVAVFLARKS